MDSPASSGFPGPGEITIRCGFIFLISSRLILSFSILFFSYYYYFCEDVYYLESKNSYFIFPGYTAYTNYSRFCIYDYHLRKGSELPSYLYNFDEFSAVMSARVKSYIDSFFGDNANLNNLRYGCDVVGIEYDGIFWNGFYRLKIYYDIFISFTIRFYIDDGIYSYSSDKENPNYKDFFVSVRVRHSLIILVLLKNVCCIFNDRLMSIRNLLC